MKLHSKQINTSNAGVYLSELGLVVALGLLATANLQAADTTTNDSDTQVSMINHPSERSKANRELKALEEEYITATIQALNRTPAGPDFSNDDVYVDYLVQVIDGKTQLTQPNFADDEIYVNHLIKILMK